MNAPARLPWNAEVAAMYGPSTPQAHKKQSKKSKDHHVLQALEPSKQGTA